MHAFTVFLHITTVAIWLGAALTFMVFGPASRRAPLAAWAHMWITLGKVQRVLVAPAAAIATVTGILLTMALAKGGGFDMGSQTWLMVMQGFGLVAGILAVAFQTPLANRMARLAERSLEKGEMDPAAERVRKALATVGSIAGVMLLVAQYFAVARP